MVDDHQSQSIFFWYVFWLDLLPQAWVLSPLDLPLLLAYLLTQVCLCLTLCLISHFHQILMIRLDFFNRFRPMLLLQALPFFLDHLIFLHSGFDSIAHSPLPIVFLWIRYLLCCVRPLLRNLGDVAYQDLQSRFSRSHPLLWVPDDFHFLVRNLSSFEVAKRLLVFLLIHQISFQVSLDGINR